VKRSWMSLPLSLALCAVALVAVPAGAEPVCDTSVEAPGGDWRHFGGDVSSTRNQVREAAIGPDTVGDLEVAWTFGNGPQGGYITSTVVAGTCAFFTDEPAFGQAWVYAVDVRTGELVWKQDALEGIEPNPSTGSWGGRAAPAVVDGRLHVNVTTPEGPDGNAPVAVAFDAATGRRLWQSDPVSFGHTTNNLSGPGVWDGLHFVASIGPDIDRNAREGYAIVDATTGETLHARTTVPPEDYERGYVGGGMWTSPAIDPDTGYLYIATDNPNMSEEEHAYSNAIIKIDLARQRDAQGAPITGQTEITNPAFGDVVDSYKGDPDNWLMPAGYENPACTTLSGLSGGGGGWAPYPCGQLDVDMGASPTLIRHPSGRLLVATSQKSGTFHMVDAVRMDRVWKKTMIAPNAYQGHSGPPANDGERVFTVANPGVVIAYDVLTGEELWTAPISDGGLSHHPLTIANGVVYIVSNMGHLFGFDAETGEQLLMRTLADDSGVQCPAYTNPNQVFLFGPFAWSAGVTVANGMVIAACDAGPGSEGSAIVAYQLPGR
jgi:polyvinyl alcohol dehydrogenase (cytochrome)